MKIALLADLHGNSVATLEMEKVLNKLQPNQIWCLGDAVGKGPESAFTCDWVRKNCNVVVGGNWDYGISKMMFNDQYYWNQLGEERMEWLRNLPRETELTMSGITFRLFHGRPVTELMFVQTPSQELKPLFSANGKTYGGLIFADSHRPFVRVTDMGYFINTGSVGNGIGIPKAHALVMEGELDSNMESALQLSILSVPYDNAKAAEIARCDKDLPHQDAYIREIVTGEYAR